MENNTNKHKEVVINSQAARNFYLEEFYQKRHSSAEIARVMELKRKIDEWDRKMGRLVLVTTFER